MNGSLGVTVESADQCSRPRVSPPFPSFVSQSFESSYHSDLAPLFECKYHSRLVRNPNPVACLLTNLSQFSTPDPLHEPLHWDRPRPHGFVVEIEKACAACNTTVVCL